MRLIPKQTIKNTDSSGSGKIEIWMPNNYDIPNGGTKIC